MMKSHRVSQVPQLNNRSQLEVRDACEKSID
jgi:hypothetical protein